MAQGARLFFGLLGLLTSGAALAHTGVHADGSLATGFTHPFMGLDHLLAMVAVGIWAAQLGRRHLLLLPAIFVATMAAGAVAGTCGLPLPQVEGMVALSVLVLGLLVALALNTRSLSDLGRTNSLCKTARTKTVVTGGEDLISSQRACPAERIEGRYSGFHSKSSGGFAFSSRSDISVRPAAGWAWPVSLVALFALFHGHAHGTEMPEFSAPWLYFAGFTIATASLHAFGVAAGAALKTHPGILRAGGAAIGLAGSWLLVSGLM